MVNRQVPRPIPTFDTKMDWALFMQAAGFTVMPGVPGTKMPAGPWERWEQNQSVGNIKLYWQAHPDAEVCLIAGPKLYLLDADSEESLKELMALERKHKIFPLGVVRSARGWHHYFRLPEHVIAKQSSHSSAEHPKRLDVKTGRSLLAGPGSPGKEILKWDFDHIDDLTPVTQDFVDDVARLNGQQPPSEQVERAAYDGPRRNVNMKELESWVNAMSPKGYDVWTKVGMAIKHETGGSPEGLKLYDEWSASGDDYDGPVAIRKKWDSFKSDVANPCTLGTIKYFAKLQAANVVDIFEPFRKVKTDSVLLPDVTREDLPQPPAILSKGPRPAPRIARYSLTKRIDEVERLVLDEKLICGGLVAMGETTLISAEPNTGKTALALRLLVNSIRDGSLDPKKLIYVNLDDSSRGLYEKLKLACEYGFEMLAPLFGFRASDTLRELEEMISDGSAHGSVVVIDTVTRLFDNNSKVETREFTDVSRRFSGQGGTMLLLGHCNKHRNKAGKLDYAGVSDLPNDVDCRYILDTMHVDQTGGFKVVKFENGKRRSNVRQTAAFKYSTRESQSYEELLLSVHEVNPEDYFLLSGSAAATEKEAVDVVIQILTAGPQTRMKLAVAVGERVDLSRVKIFALLERYGTADTGIQRWTVTKEKKNNAMTYKLLEESAGPRPAPVSRFSGSPVHQPATSPAQPAPTVDYEENEEFEDVPF